MTRQALDDGPRNTRRWLMNVATGYAGVLAEGLVFVALTPLVVNTLGVEGYALWILANTIAFYLKFLDFGFEGAQIRFHARFSARGRPADVQRLTSTVVTALTLGGTLACIVGVALAFTTGGLWLDQDVTHSNDFQLVLSLLAVQLFVGFPSSALDNFYEGMQRFDVRNLRSIAVLALKTSAQLAVLLTGRGIVALAAVEVLASVALLLTDLAIIGRLAPWVLRARAGFDLRIWQRIRGFALWNFFDDLLVHGTDRIGQLMVAALLPLAILGPYSLSLTIAGTLLLIVHPITDTFLPLASGLYAQGRREELSELLLTGSKGLMAICAPVGIVVACLGESVLVLWIPEVRGHVPQGLIPIVVADVFVSVFLSTPAAVLIAMNGIRTYVLLTLLEVAMFVVLALLVVPRFGIQGVAAVSLLVNLLIGLGVQLPLLARSLRMPALRLIAVAPARILLACVPALLIATLLQQRVADPEWPQLLGAAALIGLTGVAGLLVLGTSRSERQRYLQLWRNLRSSGATAAG